MANTVKMKRSAVQGKVPLVGDLALGELALNTYDGKLYAKKDDGAEAIVEIGLSDLGAPVTLSHSAGTITLDVTAGHVFEFEADVYVPSALPEVVGAVDGSTDLLNLPGGIQEGDYIFVFADGSDPYVASPVGYTEVFSEDNYQSSSDCALYYKKMGATVDSAVYVAGAHELLVVAIRGVHPSSPLNTPVSIERGTGAVQEPSITTTVDNCLAMMVVAEYETHFQENTAFNPPGYTRHCYENGGSGYNRSLYTKDIVAASVETPDWSHISDPVAYVMGLLGIAPPTPSGEKDYTLSLTNKPTTFKPIRVYLEAKADSGIWDFSAVDEWIGSAPAMDSVGIHVIDLHVSSARTVGEYLGLAA